MSAGCTMAFRIQPFASAFRLALARGVLVVPALAAVDDLDGFEDREILLDVCGDPPSHAACRSCRPWTRRSCGRSELVSRLRSSPASPDRRGAPPCRRA